MVTEGAKRIAKKSRKTELQKIHDEIYFKKLATKAEELFPNSPEEQVNFAQYVDALDDNQPIDCEQMESYFQKYRQKSNEAKIPTTKQF